MIICTRLFEVSRENEELFHNAFDLAPFGMVLTDLDGRFERINQAYCRITGYCQKELMQPDFGSKRLPHPEDLWGNILEIDRVVAGKVPAIFVEKR